MPTDKQISQLIINKLTQAQYDEAEAASNINEDELYFITDATNNDYTTAEKEKLAGIAEGANKTIVDSALSSTSTNPVQNKVVNSELAKKANQSTFDGSYNLGNFNGKTVVVLQNAINSWLANNSNIANASAYFKGDANWITLWNANNTSSTIAAGGIWTITVVGKCDSSSYIQLQASYYGEKRIYYICRINNVWKQVRQVAFTSDITKLSYLDGITENVQTQLDNKATSDYVDTVVSQKSQVQIVTWEADD